MRVVAVVVTFNRLPLLQRLVARLREVPEVDEVLVVDNASADGTGEWLAAPGVTHRTLAENRGGAGGFHDGLGWAMERGADLAWLMDDDGLPDPDCLATLLARAESSTSGARWWSTRQDPAGWSSRSGSPAGPASCTGWPTSRPRPSTG